MNSLREGQITEKVAELMARYLPNVSPLSVSDGPDTASIWPNHWGAAELAAYRGAAVEVMKLLRPLFTDTASIPRRAEREKPFFVRAETLPGDVEFWLVPRPYNSVEERFDRAGNQMFCLRATGGGSFMPAGLVVVTNPADVAYVRTLVAKHRKERV